MARRIKITRTVNGHPTFLDTARKVRKTKEFKEIEDILGKDEYKKIKKEMDHFHKTGIPRCQTCGAPMVNAYDSILKKVSPYEWKTTCGHAKNLILSIG